MNTSHDPVATMGFQAHAATTGDYANVTTAGHYSGE